MGIAYAYQWAPRERATAYQIFVDGWPLSGICTYHRLRHRTRLVGDWEATWQVITPHDGIDMLRHPAFREGARVEVKLGPIVAFAGSFPQQDFSTGEMVALGTPRQAERALTFTALEQTTSKPNTAVDAGIGRGVLDWIRRVDLGNDPVGKGDDEAATFTYIYELLDARCEELGGGVQWRVDRGRGLRFYTPDEATPKYLIMPGAGAMGVAGDERVDRYFVRYADSTDAGALKTASHPATTPAGGYEKGASIVGRGEITPGRASNITETTWGKLEGRTAFTNGLNLTRSQITTFGETPPELGLVEAGEAATRLGAPDPRGLALHTNFVIGETEYDWDEDRLQINPVGMVSYQRVIQDTTPGAVLLGG